MRIGIDLDGVLRDFVSGVVQAIAIHNPSLIHKVELPMLGYSFTQWLPFWTEKESDDYVFRSGDITEYIYTQAPPIATSIVDFNKIRKYLHDNGHELCLVSYQPTEEVMEYSKYWIDKHNLRFDDVYWSSGHDTKKDFDIDWMIDDNNQVLYSVEDSGKKAIRFVTAYNMHENYRHMKYEINRLKEIRKII
jgi:hypothetical protein